MDKRVKTIIGTAAITAIGVIIPTLAALLAYGFSANNFVMSNYIFTSGMFITVVGGAWSIWPFFMFKSKLRKARIGEEVGVQKREGLRWEYMLMAAGVLIIVAAYLAAVL